MSVIPTTRGNPQASDVATESALPLVGTASREDLQTVLNTVDADLAKCVEDRNLLLTKGGTITFPAAGTTVTFSEALKLEINSQIAGGSPTVVDLGSTTRTLSADGRMVYAVVNRTAGTAVVTDDSATLPSVVNANIEVVLIAKRRDDTGGTKRVYFRNGLTLSAGQSGVIGQTTTFYDSQLVVADSTDTTKQIKFDAAGTTGTSTTITGSQTSNRVQTLQDVTDTFVYKTTADALSNKSLALSSSNDSATTGSAATLAAFTSGIVRLTNSSLTTISGIPAGTSGQEVTVENQTGNTITILNDDAGASSGNKIYTGAGSVSMPANATFLFTYDSTASHWMLTGGSGSGSSSSGINYVANPNAETDTTGWTTYSDTQTVTITNATPAVFTVTSTTGYYNGMPIAFTNSGGALPTGLTASTTYYISNLNTDGANKFRVATTRGGTEVNTSSAGSGTHTARPLVPVTLTAGSLTGLTFSRNTSSPLRGTGDFKLAQTNSTVVAGQGVYYALTIDSADKAKVLTVSLDFNADSNFSAGDSVTAPNSGGAGDSDLEWFMYDVTNSTVISISPQIISANGSNNYTFSGTFQAASNSTSYRLVVHASKTSAAATGYNFRWDNVSVGPQTKVLGAANTDWTTYTPTGSWVSNTTYAGKWKRVGPDLFLELSVTLGGAPTSANLTINLPPGLAIDTTGPLFTGNSVIPSFGGIRDSSPAQEYWCFAQAASTTSVGILVVDSAPASWGNVTQAVPITFASGDTIQITIGPVPITGWGSTSLMSNDSMSRLVRCTAYRTSAVSQTSSGSDQKFPYNLIDIDSHGSFDTTNNRYVFPVSGRYLVQSSATFVANSTGYRSLIIYKNGSAYKAMVSTAGRTLSASVACALCGSGEVDAIAGDYVEIFGFQNSGGTLAYQDLDLTNTFLQVSRIGDNSTIAANDPVIFSATHTNATVTTEVNVPFSSGEVSAGIDTTGSYSTSLNLWTCPIAGIYEVGSNMSSGAVNSNLVRSGYKLNGGATTLFVSLPSTTNGSVVAGGSYFLKLKPGDTIEYRVSSTSSESVDTIAKIRKIG